MRLLDRCDRQLVHDSPPRIAPRVHAAAVALLYGEATPSQFTDAVVLNSTVVALRKKVNTTVDAIIRTDEAYVSAIFKDGTNLTQHIEHAIGSLDNPLSEAQLKEKFINQVALVLGSDGAQKAYSAFTNIGNMSDVGTIAQSFSGPNSTSTANGTRAGGDTDGTLDSMTRSDAWVTLCGGLLVLLIVSLI